MWLSCSSYAPRRRLSPHAKAEETAPSDISRSVTSLYIADGDDFAVTVETGICEQPFIADGKVGETAEFATVTVTPLVTLGAEELTFTLTGGGETPATLTGTLTSGGFGDFKGDIALSFVPEKVSVTADGKTFEATLTDVTSGKLSSSDAVNIARELFAERIEDEPARSTSNSSPATASISTTTSPS